jgi:hypothetical protein
MKQCDDNRATGRRRAIDPNPDSRERRNRAVRIEGCIYATMSSEDESRVNQRCAPRRGTRDYRAAARAPLPTALTISPTAFS